MSDSDGQSFRCPSCRGVGEIDNEQHAGDVSIQCPCGWHGYSKDGQVLTPQDVGRVEDILG